MAYRRVSTDPRQPHPPGLYEIVSQVTRGDARRADRRGLERALRVRHGPHVEVVDYAADDSGRLTIRYRLLPQSDAEASVQPLAVPLAVTALGVLAVLYLIWRISANVVEFVELVAEKVTTAGVIAVSAPLLIGVGLLAIIYINERVIRRV